MISINNKIFMEELKIIIIQEGDYYEWNNTFDCVIKRNQLKCWCGYVKIPLNIYNSIYSTYPNFQPYCHGGITYTEKFENYYMIGFDTSHSGDLVPELFFLHQGIWEGLKSFNLYNDQPNIDIYRDKEYVISQTNYIVEQIIDKINQKRFEKINSLQ